ncbi:MAG TPA: uracil-DNA glycosylase [Burkholderiaceae bacterium]|jgi:DNA polymerase|nr:uracil-DNA glycosylase [Burkholderiaceae bacterium]
MSLDARQRAMLAEMGVRIWNAPEPEVAEAEAPTVREEPSAPVARPTQRAAPCASAPSMDERAIAIASLPWPALRERVQDCTDCGLCESRTRTVFGVGHERARWMIVGEAPGEQEDLAGEPFVGKAGQLLDAMLRSLGLSRESGDPGHQVYIANVLKCRPPGNRNPEPQEIERCLPYLRRQIELVQPRLILAVGRFAVQALLGSGEPIGRLRGRVHAFGEVPVIVTYHPAYLLRSPMEKARAWDDLCLAREVMSRIEAPGDARADAG